MNYDNVLQSLDIVALDPTLGVNHDDICAAGALAIRQLRAERDNYRFALTECEKANTGLAADLAAARARIEKLEGAEEDRDEYQRQAKLYAERCAESDMELAAARALLRRMREDCNLDMRLWQWHPAIDAALAGKDAP